MGDAISNIFSGGSVEKRYKAPAAPTPVQMPPPPQIVMTPPPTPEPISPPPTTGNQQVQQAGDDARRKALRRGGILQTPVAGETGGYGGKKGLLGQ
jgi:hypothetical protein